ncbi:MAG: hypothetical protein AAB863_02590 [Patescibacteria group bacterium]
MNVITIPKGIAQKDDLVIIPKMEYQYLLQAIEIEGEELTPTQKRALKTARKHFKQGKLLSYEEVGKRLGFAN